MGGVCSCSKGVRRSISVAPEEIAATVTAQAASGDGKKVLAHKANRRGSVSAEAAALAAMKEKKSLIPKSDETRERLKQLIKSTLLFRDLDEEQEAAVIDALFEHKVLEGEMVIKEGEEGDNFYLIESGTFHASKNGETKFTYDGQGSFGELALMYNCPRAATVTAATAGTLWGMDRTTFRAVIVSSVVERRERYEATLRGMEIFKQLSQEQLAAIADCVTVEQFEAGDHIIRESEELATNAKFYMIDSGTVECLKTFEAKEKPQGKKRLTKTLGGGDVFGEVALLTKAPRQADCVAATKVKCLSMSRDAFERLMGPVEEVLAQHIAEYNVLNAGVESDAAGCDSRASTPSSHHTAATSIQSVGGLTAGGSHLSSVPSAASSRTPSYHQEAQHGVQHEPAGAASSMHTSGVAAGVRKLSRSSPSSRLRPRSAAQEEEERKKGREERKKTWEQERRHTGGESKITWEEERKKTVEERKPLAIRSAPADSERSPLGRASSGDQGLPSKLAAQIQEWERRMSGSGEPATPLRHKTTGRGFSGKETEEGEPLNVITEADEAKRIVDLTVEEEKEGEAAPCTLEPIVEDMDEGGSRRGTPQQ